MDRNNATIRLTVAVAAVAALAGLTACSTKPISKAGSTDTARADHRAADARRIRSRRTVPRAGHREALARGPEGHHRFENLRLDQSPVNEARLTADIRAGRVSFAYQPARDWAAVGVPGFQALMAPFAVTTVAASQRVAASPVAAAVLGQLPGYGAVGLGLIAGEPRQILSVRPLFAPPQFAGQKIRIVDNPQTAALVTALGARPVQRLASNEVTSPLRAGSVTAVETSPFYISENAYQNVAPYLTSYAVFAKFETLVASKKAWAALSPADQAAIRQAAADTRRHSGQLATREALKLTQLCQQGVVLDQPTAAQLAALARATATAAPASAGAAAVERQIQALPGTGAQPDATTRPDGCRVAGDPATATAIHQVLTPAFAHQGGGKIPPGTYVTTDTVADWQAGGQYGDDWNKAITFTTVIRADGTLRETQAPDYSDQGPAVRPLRREGGRGHVLLVPTGRELVSHREGAVELLRRSAHLRDRGRRRYGQPGHLHRASMAQDRLTGAARGGVSRMGTGQVSVILAGAVLIGGALAEAAAPGPVTPLTGADFAVGACYAAVGAWLLRAGGADRPARDPVGGWLALAVSAAWFLGTAAAALPAALPSYGAGVAVLGYRAMLTHLLLRSVNHQRTPGRGPPWVRAWRSGVLRRRATAGTRGRVRHRRADGRAGRAGRAGGAACRRRPASGGADGGPGRRRRWP